MSKHTTGPWHVSADGKIVYDEQGWAVADATVFHGRHSGVDEAKANARLIAASTDLLESLQSILDAVVFDNGRAEIHLASNSPELSAARAAIAKATGSQQ